MPIPMTAWSKPFFCGRSLAEIVGSSPSWGMDVCLSLVSVVCLKVQVSMSGWSPVQRSIGCHVSGCDREASITRRPCPWGKIQGGSNMTRTDLCVNKPHCAAAVRLWESEVTTSTSTLPPAPTTVWGRVSPTETLFPILLLEPVVNFSGRDVFPNEEFDHNALFHAPRYLLSAHHSSNSQTGLNRF